MLLSENYAKSFLTTAQQANSSAGFVSVWQKIGLEGSNKSVLAPALRTTNNPECEIKTFMFILQFKRVKTSKMNECFFSHAGVMHGKHIPVLGAILRMGCTECQNGAPHTITPRPSHLVPFNFAENHLGKQSFMSSPYLFLILLQIADTDLQHNLKLPACLILPPPPQKTIAGSNISRECQRVCPTSPPKNTKHAFSNRVL